MRGRSLRAARRLRPPEPFEGEWQAGSLTYVGQPFGDCLDGFPAEDFACGRLKRKRPGDFETEDVQAKRAGLPCLLRGPSRHRPIRALHGMGVSGEANWVEVSKCGSPHIVA